MIYQIVKKDKIIKGFINLVSSKSESNRALIIQSLCKSKFEIKNLSTAHDTIILQRLLKLNSTILDAEDAGTTFRFLVPYLSMQDGEWILTGTQRMQQRPIGILVESLKKLGARIQYINQTGYPPLKIRGTRLTGRNIDIEGNISSQFISALLLIAPVIKNGLILNLKNDLSSVPYIKLTLNIMKHFGIQHFWKNNTITIPQQNYRAIDFTIQADWSAASYWYQMVSFADEADLFIKGLKKESSQGDIIISEIMKHFGVITKFSKQGVNLSKSQNPPYLKDRKFYYDFSNCPDLAQTLSVICAGLKVNAKIKGLHTLPLKETNRIAALKNELKKIGISLKKTNNNFYIAVDKKKTYNLTPIKFSTYNDHRMAMSFAPLAILMKNIIIEDAECVSKSYPSFWEDMEQINFRIKKIPSL